MVTKQVVKQRTERFFQSVVDKLEELGIRVEHLEQLQETFASRIQQGILAAQHTHQQYHAMRLSPTSWRVSCFPGHASATGSPPIRCGWWWRGRAMEGWPPPTLASATLDVFGNVLSQSGAFWWRPETDTEHEWLIHQFVQSVCLPLRFYLDVGTFENGFKDPRMLVANRHLRDVFRAKGYPVVYAEFVGGHDYPCWEITLPHGLLRVGGDRRRLVTSQTRQGAPT